MNLLQHDNKCNYYFDRITVNTGICKDDVKNFLPVEELNKYGKLKIKEALGQAKSNNYKTRIEIYDGTDSCIELFSKFDLADSRFWHIEIAKDIEFDTMQEAEQFKTKIEGVIQKKWERDRFDIEGTKYIGKSAGKRSGLYLRFYTITAEKNPFSNKPAFHFEFVLETWPTITKNLRLKHTSELGKAKDIFQTLEAKYLTAKEINRERLRKNLIKAGIPAPRAKQIAYRFNDLWDFSCWVKRQQSLYYRKLHKRALNKRFGKTPRNLNKFDKFFIDRNISYYLKNKKT